MSVEVEATSALERYVPRIATDWSDDAPHKSWQEFDATLCFVDISGFTLFRADTHRIAAFRG